MRPTAYVVHRTRQRMRLRVPEKRGEPEWFGQAAASLERLDWVDRVETGPLSASLILYGDATGDLNERLAQIDVFQFQPQAPRVPPATEQIKHGLARIDRALQSPDDGRTNLRSLLFLLMLILAGVQMARGQVMVPAVSLLWYAMQLVLEARTEPSPQISDTTLS